MGNQLTAQQIKWLESVGVDVNNLSRTGFNYRLPDGTIIPAGINPGQAATIQVGNYTQADLYQAAENYLSSIGARKVQNTVPGPTYSYILPNGQVLPVNKDFYENLGREQLQKTGQNVVQTNVLDRNTAEGAQIASQLPYQTIDPKQELARALAETPIVAQNTNQNTKAQETQTPQTITQNSIQPPMVNLQPGQTGPEVKQLQDFLVSQGFMTSEQVATGPGIYGPQTTAAVKAWQEAKGVDNSTGPGYWGPRSIAATQQGIGVQTSSQNVDQVLAEAKELAKENPIIKALMDKGNTFEDIYEATTTGDLSKLTDFTGQPFSLEDQQAALAQAEKDLAGYYKSLEEKDTADIEASMAERKRQYQEYLTSAGENFQKEKEALDTEAVNKGVLFSGSRAQREQDLKNKYEREQESQRASLSYGLGANARNYQYTYGNEAANKLSSYYNVEQNVYNPKVATGGVSRGTLSSIYNPSQYNYQGTRLAEKTAAAQQRATGLLTNKANKLLESSYLNKI